MLIELIIPAFIIASIWAYMAIIEKKILKYISHKSLFIYFGLFVGLVSLILLLYYNKDVKKDIDLITTSTKISFKLLIFYALIYIIAAFIYLKLMKEHHSYMVIALTYTTPLFVTLFSYLELKEDINIKSVLGVLLIVSGSVTLSLQKH